MQKHRYRHCESMVVKECFEGANKKKIASACRELASIIDSSTAISLDSSCSATSDHPAFRAIVAIGEPALGWLMQSLRGKGVSWWHIMAIQAITDRLGLPIPVPDEHRGKFEEILEDYSDWLKGHLTKSQRLRRFAGQTGRCHCGEPGEWIADGICRYGWYCERCSEEALRHA